MLEKETNTGKTIRRRIVTKKRKAYTTSGGAPFLGMTEMLAPSERLSKAWRS